VHAALQQLVTSLRDIARGVRAWVGSVASADQPS
jgi:hypothetical protein